MARPNAVSSRFGLLVSSLPRACLTMAGICSAGIDCPEAASVQRTSVCKSTGSRDMLKTFGLKKIVMSFALLAAAACANPPAAEQQATGLPRLSPPAPKPLRNHRSQLRLHPRPQGGARLLCRQPARRHRRDGRRANAAERREPTRPAPSCSSCRARRWSSTIRATTPPRMTGSSSSSTPSATGTKIHVRGATDVVNQFGGNCLTCHAQAEAKWDMICEQTPWLRADPGDAGDGQRDPEHRSALRRRSTCRRPAGGHASS